MFCKSRRHVSHCHNYVQASIYLYYMLKRTFIFFNPLHIYLSMASLKNKFPAGRTSVISPPPKDPSTDGRGNAEVPCFATMRSQRQIRRGDGLRGSIRPELWLLQDRFTAGSLTSYEVDSWRFCRASDYTVQTIETHLSNRSVTQNCGVKHILPENYFTQVQYSIQHSYSVFATHHFRCFPLSISTLSFLLLHFSRLLALFSILLYLLYMFSRCQSSHEVHVTKSCFFKASITFLFVRHCHNL